MTPRVFLSTQCLGSLGYTINQNFKDWLTSSPCDFLSNCFESVYFSPFPGLSPGPGHYHLLPGRDSNCPSNSTPTSNQTILQIVLTQMPLKHKLDYVSPLLKTFQWLTMIPRPNVFHGLRL